MANIFKDADKRRRTPPVDGVTMPEEIVATPELVAEETVVTPDPVAEEKPVKKQTPKKKAKKIDALIGPAEGGEKKTKKTFSIYISEDLYAWVEHEAGLRNKSVSSLIEQILTDLRDEE